MLEKIKKLGISEREAKELLNVSKNIEEDYNKLLMGYPIQYLIGYVDFYGNKIEVNENVLIPRYETEFLVEKTINYCKKMFEKKLEILDIGTGSGAIAIALSKEIDSNITACDISKDALKVAISNAKYNKVNVQFIKSNIYEKIDKRFDIIISNPPYIDENEKIMYSVQRYEPHLALYAKDNGLYYYEEILKNAKDHLNDKYLIAFEIGWWQANLIKLIAKKYFKNSIIIIEKDLCNKDRYIFIKNE